MSLVKIIVDQNKSVSLLKQFKSVLDHVAAGHTIQLKSKEDNYIAVSTYTELLEHLKTSDPIFYLFVSSLKQQNNASKNIFTGIYATSFLLNFDHYDIPHFTLNNRAPFFNRILEEFLESKKLRIDIGKLNHIFLVIKSIILEPAHYFKEELNHLALLISKVFSASIDGSIKIPVLEKFQIVKHFPSSIMESHFHSGYSIPIIEEKIELLKFSKVRIMIFEISLSLDIEDLIDEGRTKIVVKEKENFKASILKHLKALCKDILPYVDLVICQKVVHPLCKKIFEENFIFVMQRVGRNSVNDLVKYLNCKIIKSPILPHDIKSFISVIDKVNIDSIGTKQFLILHHKCLPPTLVLNTKSERTVNVLEEQVQSCLVTLESLTFDSFVLPGNGCFETMLVVHLMSRTDEKVSENDFVTLKNIYAKSFLEIAKSVNNNSNIYEHFVDTLYNHHWINYADSSTCCCGGVKKTHMMKFINFKEVVLCSTDLSFVTKDLKIEEDLKPVTIDEVNAVKSLAFCKQSIQAAVQIAQTVLRIGVQIVQN